MEARSEINADHEEAHEKRTFASTEQPSGQPKPCLEFPPFYTQTLLQSSWNTRDSNGRIKLLLSEQLISKTTIPGEPAFGATNDIVCFLFQHAPNGMLGGHEAVPNSVLINFRRT